MSSLLEDALVIVNGMIGVHGIIVPASYTKVFGTIFPAQVLEQFEALAQSILTSSGVVLEGELTWRDTAALVHLMLLLGIVFWLPNTQQLMVKFDPVYELYPGDRSPDSPIRVRWRPNFIWAIAVGLLVVVTLLNLNNVTEFLYFQF